MSTLFTPAQIQEIATIFGLTPNENLIQVRDGFISKGDMVWWRHIKGYDDDAAPEFVDSSESTHWTNIKDYPSAYQIAEPLTTPRHYVD